MIKSFIKRYYLLILLVTINIIVHWVWFSNLHYLTSGDSSLYLPETQKELARNSVQIYDASTNFGQLSLNAGYNVIEFFQGVFAQLGIFYNISFRILYLWPYVFLSPIAAYFLFSKFIKSKTGVFIAALVYLFNTYILIIQTGEILILLGSVFLTLSLLFAYKFYIEERSLRNYAALLFFLFLLSSYEFRIFYIGIFVIGLFVLYESIFIKRYLKDLLSFIGAIFITLLLNFYWILPLSIGNKISSNVLFSRTLFGSGYFDISSALTLFHRFWTGGMPAAFINQPIPFYFWLIPVFAIVALIPKKKNPFLLYFALLALVGIFLTKQAAEPFPNVYGWLYQHFPGFNAFREASKFYILTVLGYSVLVGSAVGWLLSFENDKIRPIIRTILVAVIAVIFLWNTKPLITGEFGTLFVPRNIPQDYLIFEDFILQQPEYFRTLWVPTDSRWSIYTNHKPEVSDVTILGSEWSIYGSSVPGYNNWPTNEQITEILKTPNAKDLLNNSSIKYVIVPTEDVANNDDFFLNYGGAQDPDIRQWYINQLDQVSWLKKINIGTKNLVVYENENYRPHIYTTSAQETIHKNVPYENVVSVQKDPTEYTVQLRDINTPVFVNFSESFDPNWKVRVGSFAWNKVFDTNYFLPDAFHSESDATLNSFYIDPNYIRQHLPTSAYKVNPDGSIDLDLTIYFKPQSHFYIGLIISGTTLFVCLGYLGWDFASRRKKKLATTSTIKEENHV
jgi:hypothetical protein